MHHGKLLHYCKRATYDPGGRAPLLYHAKSDTPTLDPRLKTSRIAWCLARLRRAAVARLIRSVRKACIARRDSPSERTSDRTLRSDDRQNLSAPAAGSSARYPFIERLRRAHERETGGLSKKNTLAIRCNHAYK